MYRLLLFAILTATLHEFHVSGPELVKCQGLSCGKTVGQLLNAVTRIDWKPLSVFPKEAAQFK